MEISPIYSIVTPTEWQPPPEWMNFHYLTRAERCPRSAALRYATYETLWKRSGYPDKPNVAALSGTIVHATVGRIVRALAEMDISSIQDPRYISALKNLGGYSKLISESIANVTNNLAGNPRFERIRSYLLVALDRRIPTIREHVQFQLARMSWSPTPSSSPKPAGTLKALPSANIRPPLGQGAHFEIELRHPGLKWRGFADLVELLDQQCTIKDFKTGEQSDDHLLQLQIYALLWSHDDELNPAHIPVTKLAICYPNEECDITYTDQEAATLTEKLKSRTADVRQAVVGLSSHANLSAEHCPKCDVRHLCSDYWSDKRPVIEKQDISARSQFDDIQLTLESRTGQNTWSAKCRKSNNVPIGTTVLLRWSQNDCDVLEQLPPRTAIRFTGALVSTSEDHDLTIVTCLTTTDLIVLHEPAPQDLP